MEQITQKDRNILRELTKRQMEYATSPRMQELKKLWIDHNACKPTRPLMVVETGFAQDVIEPQMRCEGKTARELEWHIYYHLVNHEIYKDDRVVQDFFGVTYPYWFKPFGLDVKIIHTDGVGHQFVEQIHDLGEDFHLLHKSTYGCDREAAQRKLDLCNDLFGDIIPVKMVGQALYSVPTQDIVHIMSMETMLFSMYDYPDEFKRMMDALTDDYIEYFNFLSKEGFLLSTTGPEAVGNGTFAFTDALPGAEEREKRLFTPKDVWGFMDSQETVGISPEMYAEFIFPYYKKVADCYGMMSYGCCEPVHPFWDNCLSKLENLRKISISPWCDEEMMGERLRGTNIVYHRKPSPNFLGVGSVLDEEALRAHFAKTLRAAKGCTIEFTQRDVIQINSTGEKVARYVEIFREECEKV